MSYPRQEEVEDHIRKCNWLLLKKLINRDENYMGSKSKYFMSALSCIHSCECRVPDEKYEPEYYAAYKECQNELFNMPNASWRDLISVSDLVYLVHKISPRLTVKEYEGINNPEFYKIDKVNDNYRKLITFLIDKY